MALDRTAENLTDADILDVTLSVKRILVPTDGSATSVEATRVAVAMAKCFGAEIIACFVDPGHTMEPLEAMQEEAAEGVHHTRAGLTVAIKTAEKNEIDVTPVVREGGIADQIVEAAREHDVQMIVIGSEGRTGLKKFMLGSVAEAVVKNAHVPVMVVRHCSTEFCMAPRVQET
jgi:nucleotide-binding universal stress UspA family protein